MAFWIRNPDAPFVTLVRVAATYCHPEASDDAYDVLKELARRNEDEEVILFKRDLREAILNPGVVPEADLDYEVQYDDGSAVSFLHRLWRDLYPDEPIPGSS